MTIADIFAEARLLCDADSTSYPDAALLRRVNTADEETVAELIAASGTWQFDDTNYTDLPIGITDLVAGQYDYSFASTFLEIERVSVLDQNGLWHTLDPIDKEAINVDMTEYQKVNGLPNEYDKQGSSIFLYPAPAAANVTLTGGLKVYFKRTASVFTSGDVSTGTKAPGFASPYHVILSYKAAMPYCASYKKDRVPMLINEITRIRKDLLAFYARREQDVRKRLTMAAIRHR
jgi:hypothetical protein